MALPQLTEMVPSLLKKGNRKEREDSKQ